MNCVSDYKGTKKGAKPSGGIKRPWRFRLGTRCLDGDKEVPEVRRTSHQKGPFCLVNKLMYKYFLNNFLRIITILFH